TEAEPHREWPPTSMSTIMTNHDTHASIPAITDEAFEAEVMQAPFPILVDFSAGGCAPHAD
ncbi:MAG: hypothetical protein WAK98_17750, partial [Gemmobacter sp.]